MVYAKKKINPLWYLVMVANVLPILAVLGGVWELGQIAYFYWAECALAALFALGLYAKYLIVFFMMTGAIGFIVYVANPMLLDNIEPIIIFWSLFGLCWLGYIEVGKSIYGQMIKKLSPREQLTIYLIFLTFSILICFSLTNLVEDNGLAANQPASLAQQFFYWVPEGVRSTFYVTLFSVAIIVPTISITLLKVIDMIGQKHFIDFILGTYHHPIEQNRIVLFLDMVGSSSIAEKLEPKKSMEFIAQFIYDCGFIFRVHNGDILNYTGDGLVVLWPRNQANNALAAVYQLRNHFLTKQNRSRYWKKFGMVPDFRIGIHAGPVVLSQIGEEKLFIGLYGDVVNTAARLEQMNKELGTNILISSEVVQGLNQSWKALLKPLGDKEVRGRDEKVNVFALYKEI